MPNIGRWPTSVQSPAFISSYFGHALRDRSFEENTVLQNAGFSLGSLQDKRVPRTTQKLQPSTNAIQNLVMRSFPGRRGTSKLQERKGASKVAVPSVVCLRKYIKVLPKMPPLNRRTVLMRDGGLCQYCSKKAENIDHVIPRCRGGKSTWDNVVASCESCNSRKAHFLLKDTNLKLRKQPGPPRHVSWVYGAVWKVDPGWRPYIGDLATDMYGAPLATDASRPELRPKARVPSAPSRTAAAAAEIAKAERPVQSERAEVAQAVVSAYTA